MPAGTLEPCARIEAALHKHEASTIKLFWVPFVSGGSCSPLAHFYGAADRCFHTGIPDG